MSRTTSATFGRHSALARFTDALNRAEARRQPLRQLVSVWDGAQNCYRHVDPANTHDFLAPHAASLINSRRPCISRRRRRVSLARLWRAVRPFLPSITLARHDAQRELAAGYLHMARTAAARGDHLAAQMHARSCQAILSTLPDENAAPRRHALRPFDVPRPDPVSRAA